MAARSETFEDPFYQYSLPEAILRFRQGFGRLIRTQIDHGVVAVLDRHGLTGVFSLLIGRGSTVGEALVNDRRVPLISFTGSSEIGRRVAERVAGRLGRPDQSRPGL